MKRYLLTALCSLALPALAAETATLLKEDSLRSKPFLDAPSQATLQRGSSVTVLKKQGAWANVQLGKQTGWVRSLSLKSGTAAIPGSNMASLNTGRLGSGKIVNTTGIRGLSSGKENEAGALAEAKFDAAALARAEAISVSEQEAAAFAKAAKLQARRVAWLAEGK
ncbi:SH3 domain-containing protein [Chitinimonas sp. BJB300]|uniref:SH3 domain-containing protein n=1 Tax=Chitinimonas sp. BJB300 TaxID=1559339 RepID=UPI000C1136EC|nr:SH3 domain-containing protein [Chitinimonas sp. BJB300]PHV11348.1 ligand-binding protein SH3 [Chitinimonas sp. BJB300]